MKRHFGDQPPHRSYVSFYDDARVRDLAADFYKAGKTTAVLCRGACILLKTKVDGRLIVEGKTWTGFANSEQKFADEFVGKRVQPFWIRMKRGNLVERISSSRAASKHTPCATAI